MSLTTLIYQHIFFLKLPTENLENDLEKKEQDLLSMLESPETNSDSLAEPSAPSTKNTNEKTNEESDDTELPDVISQEKENNVTETENDVTEMENDSTETEVVEENEKYVFTFKYLVKVMCNLHNRGSFEYF